MAKAIVFSDGVVTVDKSFHEEGHIYCAVCQLDITDKERHMKAAIPQMLGLDSRIPPLCSVECCDVFITILSRVR